MRELYDGLILFHGSYCEVSKPDLQRCSARKDFGKGFYLTSSREQAESFLRTAIGKAVAKGDAMTRPMLLWLLISGVHLVQLVLGGLMIYVSVYFYRKS